jgi:pimeloyl-ACP methyl ester carboxylesterase
VRLAALLSAVESGEAAAVAEVVSLDIPPSLPDTPAGWSYIRQRTDQLLRDGLARGLSTLPDQVAVADRSQLGAVRAPALVLGCRGDELHPAAVAEQLAAALPQATLHVYDKPGVLWTQRADLRARISEFLNG